MVLTRAIYELFEAEIDSTGAAGDCEHVYLGRQLRLELTAGPSIYIAWTWGRMVADEYYVEWRRNSFCVGESEIEHDASNSPIWAGLVGRKFSLVYCDLSLQVLEVRSSDAVVFGCSFDRGSWGMDTLYIGCKMPVGQPLKFSQKLVTAVNQSGSLVN